MSTGVVRRKKLNSHRICSVYGCSTGADSETALHSFPKNKLLRKTWLIKCRIGKKISKNARVCSKHFTEADYKLRTCRGHAGKRKLLTRASVPSQNLPKPSFSRETSVRRQITRIQAQQSVPSDLTHFKNVIPIAEPCPDTCVQIDLIAPPTPECEFSLHCTPVMPDANNDLIEPAIRALHAHDVGVQVNTFDENVIIKTSPVLAIISTEAYLYAWTGISSFKLLAAIEDNVIVCMQKSEKGALTLTEKIILVFTKLKSNLSFIMLASIFDVTATTVSRTFASMLPLISSALRPVVQFQDMVTIRCNLPKCFHEHFSNVRAILDCSEVSIQLPNCTNCRISTYSHYKGTNTSKFLVCVTPSGTISFISKAYSGKCSDKQIFNNENLIDKFDEGDGIMVDKGFAIEYECKNKNITLVRPVFSKGAGIQFDEDEVVLTTGIAAARVHVERVIQRIKLFSILNDKIDHNILKHLDDILIIIAAMTNLARPILADDKF